MADQRERFEKLGCELWHKVNPHPGEIYNGSEYMLTEKQAEMVWGMIGRCAELYRGQAESQQGQGEATINDGAMLIRKIEACDSIGPKLILLKNFMLKHTASPSGGWIRGENHGRLSALLSVRAAMSWMENSRLLHWIDGEIKSAQTQARPLPAPPTGKESK